MANIDYYIDTANNHIKFPLYLIVLSITKIAISLEPYAQSAWFSYEVSSLYALKGIQWTWKVSYYLFLLISLNRITLYSILDNANISYLSKIVKYLDR